MYLLQSIIVILVARNRGHVEATRSVAFWI